MTTVFAGLNEQAIKLAVSALQSNDCDLLEQLGLGELDEKIIKRLRGMTMRNLVESGNWRGSLVEIRFNSRQLNLFVEFAGSKDKEEELLDMAIKAGIRQPMLYKLKGVSRKEFSMRRQSLGMALVERGRIELLSEKDELLTIQVWSQLVETTDYLERLVLLHNNTGIDIGSAWHVIEQLSLEDAC